MQYFSDSTASFSALEKQILNSGLSLGCIKHLINAFRDNEYIFVADRHRARKAIMVMVRLRSLTNGKYFAFIPSESLLPLVSPPVNRYNGNIPDDARKTFVDDLTLLFHFLAHFHLLTDSYNRSEIDSFSSAVAGAEECKEKAAEIATAFHREYAAVLSGVNDFMDYQGGLKRHLCDVFIRAGADCCGVQPIDSSEFQIHVGGTTSEDDFMAVATEKFPALIASMEYTHYETPIQLDSGLVIGATLNANALVVTKVSPFLPSLATINGGEGEGFAAADDLSYWQNISEHARIYGCSGDTQGTAGCFLNLIFPTKIIRVVLTAAHVPFSGLELSKLQNEPLASFNTTVPYAHYSNDCDICVLPVDDAQSASNASFRLTRENNNFKLWGQEKLYSGCAVLKIGATTGVTVGKLKSVHESITINGNEYCNVCEIEADFDCFSDHGDSGAVYYTINEFGFVPFAIHRCSRDDGKFAYGSFLNHSLEYLKEKLHFETVRFD